MLENENDKRLKGVTIREHEHKVGQFADDTAAMLEGYQHLKKLFEIIPVHAWRAGESIRVTQATNRLDARAD